jgi:CheY-like chemotaxis protein
MMTMAMDCIEKVRYGITTLEELERVFVLEDQLTEKCPNCERLLDPDFTICPYCSYAISHVCPGCNRELDPEWTVCPYCRTDVTGGQQGSWHGGPSGPQPHSPPRPQSGKYPVPPQLNTQRSIPLGDTPRATLLLPSGSQSDGSTAIPPISRQQEQMAIVTIDPAEKLHQMLVSREEPSFNILLVENDEILLMGLQSYLGKERFNVQVARDGYQALEQVIAFKPQLAIIDIMTLRMDGYEFIRALRQDISTTFIPIIILSTKESVEDKLLGFTLGIDDYLDKPFAPEELITRIRAALRRVYG